MCKNCGKREATEIWVGDGGVMGYIHGASANWCKICCIEEQLRYAKKIAESIPELERKLRELNGESTRGAEFDAFVERCSAEVALWPEWKREPFGLNGKCLMD